MSYAFLFKFIIIGDSGVGKSCLLLQFIDKRFRQRHEVTIGVEFGAKMITAKNKNIKLQIWDTAGQQSFKSITRGYYRSAAGAILVYDITNKNSFLNAAQWLQQAKTNGNPQLVFLLVGNKCDLQNERKVSYEEGKKFAEENNLNFLQISAKTAFQVQEAFQKNAQTLIDKIQTGKINLKGDNPGIKQGTTFERNNLEFISENQKKYNKKSGCC